MSIPWSDQEVELIVADYFAMLTDELRGVPVNKAARRRNLMPLLDNRNETSVEFKHRNISAVLIELAQPYIKGYRPLANYQKILFATVIRYLNNNQDLERLFALYADIPVNIGSEISFKDLITDPPSPTELLPKKEIIYNRPLKIDYLERERSNIELGEQGEKLVIEYEKWRLIEASKESYADAVEWTSKEKGDGYGYDILSKNTNGTDRYIEVKTTKLGIETPIFFSIREYEVSKEKQLQYYLYRLYNFTSSPKLFIKTGSFDSFCTVTPVQYKGII